MNDVICDMKWTGSKDQNILIGMGALCKFYPEKEINAEKTPENKYFCDLGAIGLLNEDSKTNKYK